MKKLTFKSPVHWILAAAMLAVLSFPASLSAQNVEVSAQQWETLSEEERQRIEEILRSSKLLTEGDSIEPIPMDGAASDVQPQLFGLPTSVCNTACDALAGVALAACTGLTSGTGIAVCSAAAEGGREICRSRC